MTTDTNVAQPSPAKGEYEELRGRIAAFVEQACFPEERAFRASNAAVDDGLRLRLNDAAREAGVFAPHVSEEFGGRGLPHLGRAVAFETAGYSILGPIALHCAAPDEGNQHLLDVVTNPAQREEFLRPLAQGARSCFMMTEPGGAGADPGQLATVAVRDGDDYVINGRKWFITGAKGARFSIIMARDGEAADARPSMFLTPMDTPGIDIVEDMEVMAHESPGGHCVIDLHNVRVPKDRLLGEAGEAFRYAQIRLAPARLTHCMRWLGAARRCHDIARAHAVHRKAFGKTLGAHQGIGFMLADNEIDIHMSRVAIEHACALLDSGAHGRHESSMVKVFVSEAVGRVVDRAVQILGGLGVTGYTPVEHIYRSIRAFRIYDGPSETHRWAIARKSLPDPSEAPEISIAS